jgi:hypothetical protein
LIVKFKNIESPFMYSIILICYVFSLGLQYYINVVDAAYKTHGYKVQSLVRLKIVWNSPDVSKYIKKKKKKSVIRLKFRKINSKK